MLAECNRREDSSSGLLGCAGSTVAEVDSVLTSGEVQQLLEAHGRALSELPSARLDSLVAGVEEDGQLYGLPGGSGAATHLVLSICSCSLVTQFSNRMTFSSPCLQSTLSSDPLEPLWRTFGVFVLLLDHLWMGQKIFLLAIGLTELFVKSAVWFLCTGGYLDYIFRTAAAQLFGQDVGHGPLPMRVLRNADFQEVSLEVAGRPALRFALAYGFRNIQTLVRL